MLNYICISLAILLIPFQENPRLVPVSPVDELPTLLAVTTAPAWQH